ncbi:Gfo/Idh/MocA family protein [Fodinibius sediminis]|uniref:Predicted dehydrogenase n=1 Tax=Fodinibius sediminis TaxID=1214077 RepID=A0A521CFA2_9BACT|nr:Gfo/Idh/MocA family oxidoreductase [Fodinibius sediminis]SMO58055.1 Predicted dehydrogenase [Fodinibius sediminis]
MSKNKQSRREFLSTAAWSAVGTIGAAGLLSNCASTNPIKELQEDTHLSLLREAPDGEPLRAGLVGCGGRGSGAAVNFVDAGPNLEIVALGDVFEDQLQKCRTMLKKARDIDVPEENCYSGFDSYKQVIDSGVDIVIFATPPHFRPQHVEAAIEAGKHVFQEKPVAVDPVGARRMMATTKKAKEKNLCMVSGTIRRYQKDFIETQRRVAQGQIGEIVGANIIRNGGAIWWVERKPEWSDMEYMLRNWQNFSWLSADHYVEQFIHELDVMNWFVDEWPVKAIGYGGAMHNPSGNKFDHFSVEYEYADGKKTHCSTRQINGCDNSKTQHITGTKGYADATGSLYNHDGELIWEYPYPEDGDTESIWQVKNPYVQEHIELVTAIRTGNYINDSETQVNSTRMALMGRMAAYTGKEITWDEVLNSDLSLGPDAYEFGPVEGIAQHPPVVGSSTSSVERYA